MTMDEVTHRVIKAAMTAHSAIGPGLLEKAYDACLYYELGRDGLQFEHQRKIPVTYQAIRIDAGFRVIHGKVNNYQPESGPEPLRRPRR